MAGELPKDPRALLSDADDAKLAVFIDHKVGRCRLTHVESARI